MNMIGFLLVGISASGCGFLCAKSMKRRVDVIAALLALVGHLRNEIGSFRKPVRDILTEYADHCLEETGIEELIHASGLNGAINQIEIVAGSACAEVLQTLSEQLGKTCSDEQVTLCRTAEERLEIIFRNEHSALPAKTKLCKTLGICCGLMLVILLL